MSVEKAAKAECITETMLKQYLDGTLCENSAGELERHIQDCDTCRRLMVNVMDSCAQPMWVSMLGLANRSDIDTASAPARTGRISDTGYLTTKACDEESPNRFANFPVLPGFAPVRRLGSGSTGEVWEVEDVLLGRAVAVKWLRHASPSAVDVQRLLNEAQALARLRHPGIVRILEVSTRDQPAIVMDLVRGPSLAEKINGRAIGEREA
ncbi:MAG: protein kinase domain-containing protein, partial [Bacteroidota bacterium]